MVRHGGIVHSLTYKRLDNTNDGYLIGRCLHISLEISIESNTVTRNVSIVVVYRRFGD